MINHLMSFVLISLWGCAAQEATFEDAAAEEFAVLNAHKADDGPAATAYQNLDTGVVDLDIDVSVLGLSRPPPLVVKLLGANWQVCSSRWGPGPVNNKRVYAVCKPLWLTLSLYPLFAVNYNGTQAVKSTGCKIQSILSYVPRMHSIGFSCGASQLADILWWCYCLSAGYVEQACCAGRHCVAKNSDACRLQKETGY